MPISAVRALTRWVAPLVLALSASPAFADEVVPPQVLTRVPAQLPSGAAPPTQDHVLLEFTIGLDGKVSDVVVVESAGPAWDDAAISALRAWTFRPAVHQGQPTPSRTRLPFNVRPKAPPPPPAPEPVLDAGPSGETTDAGDAGPAPSDAGSLALAPDAGHFEHDDGQHPLHELSTTVVGKSIPKSRGVGDFQLEVGALAFVPRATPAELLKLAPGILLTNEGGALHPEAIFLRGFDAKEGQDLELSVDGVPVNDSGNLHGNGFADLHFLIPELVEGLRVIEGPFDPRQGNYAVAGSADYQLGLGNRGLTLKAEYGSFDTQRLVALFRPPTRSSRTFAGAQLFRTQGFGQNRDAISGAALAQYEGSLGESTSIRSTVQAYFGSFHSAGVLRQDQVASGEKSFFDTNDFAQGGESARVSGAVELHGHEGRFTHHHQAFLIHRLSRLRENFTGFLHDVQLPQQNPHPQRGDLLDRTASATTAGLRGWGKVKDQLLGRTQELEVGYFARFDATDGQQQRRETSTNAPYRKDLDLQAYLGDVGLYADANLQPLDWLVLRGGVRAELLTYLVHDRCAVKEVRRPDATDPPFDDSCLDQRDFGVHVEPDVRRSAVGTSLMPRGSLLVGPFKGFTFTASGGTGVRSIDPVFVADDTKTPFARIVAWEGGVGWQRELEPVELSVRAVGFGTRVDQDLVFSEQAGRAILGGATTRAGALVAARARGRFFDVAAHGTWVRSTFDDTGFQVPYVPDLVTRLDGALFGALPWELWRSPLEARLGTGVTFVGQRALPFGQRSDVIFTVDANLELAWRWVTFGMQVTNLFDRRYRLSEFNFASDFVPQGLPTLVPARHFTAGAPRAVLFTLAVNLGGSP